MPSRGITDPLFKSGRVADHYLELKSLMSLVASEKCLEGISFHCCGPSVVMQTHAGPVQLDYDVSPAAAEFLKLLFGFDVRAGLCNPMIAARCPVGRMQDREPEDWASVA